MKKLTAILTAAAAIGIAGWALVGGPRSDRTGESQSRAAPEMCPRDALPLEARAVRRSAALVRADARRWIRSSARFEVLRAARAVWTGGSPRCEAFGQRAVLVWLTAPAERATWEVVVYRAPTGYRIWRASACCTSGPTGPSGPPGDTGPRS